MGSKKRGKHKLNQDRGGGGVGTEGGVWVKRKEIVFISLSHGERVGYLEENQKELFFNRKYGG